MSASVIPAASGGIPLLGHALRLRRNPLEFFESLREQSDIVRIKLGPQGVYVLSSAELVRQALVVEQRHFDKGAAVENAGELIGNGLLSSEGEEHRRQRLLMQPAFRRDRIAHYAEIMRNQIIEQTATWEEGRVLDVREEMTALTLAVTGKTLISSDLGNDLAAEIQHGLPRIFDLLYKKMVSPLPVLNKLPLPRNREWAKRLARLHPMVDRVIANYRRDESSARDLLGMLLNARDAEAGAALSDQEIHDQITTILVAGAETTAATLSWVFYLLTEHPEVEARLHAEVDQVLAGRPAEYADCRQLTYTAQVISESLRCYPPAWILTRRATEDVELGGFRIPKGASVMFSPYVVHRDSRLFADPERFDPDRWSPERVGEIPREAMVQFGGGSRKCIGDVFAVVEATLALATIAGRWRLCAQPGSTFEKAVGTTFSPRNLFLTLTERGR
ncbi:cytochrome P450 [Nocardia amamiensis]|uniref:cytochrome P450 n=1 Tax=Nocardia amamiensis TaxID=404578 RepID=UPI00082EFACE|nr:cytochrome P450 [Nocardia amamiensis]